MNQHNQRYGYNRARIITPAHHSRALNFVRYPGIGYHVLVLQSLTEILRDLCQNFGLSNRRFRPVAYCISYSGRNKQEFSSLRPP